jgi:hypothetical protein
MHQYELAGGRVALSSQPLFEALESVVRDAALSRSEATLIASELESIGLRWEPPELVLQHLMPRLPGLRALYEPTDDYSRLLLVAQLLLLCVCARLVTRPSIHRARYPSGFRALVEDGAAPSARRRRA